MITDSALVGVQFVATSSSSVTSSHFSGDVYYAEYPLAFAACLAFESIYDFLLDHGADPNLQDSYGNTVLHMCVIKNKPAMYSYAARHPVKKADQWKKNFRRYDSWPSNIIFITRLSFL